MSTEPSSLMSSHPSASNQTYPQIILFGDSITEAAEYSLLPPLRDAYNRKADILNRGFGGYTAPMALDILPKFFPFHSQSRVLLMTVFFGANDACLPGNMQHVPLQKYVESIEGIILNASVRTQATKLVLIVPAPVDEWGLSPRDPNDPNSGLSRTAVNTKRYGDACRDVGARLNLPVVDLWTLFMQAAGWDGGTDKGQLPGSKECVKNEVLGKLLLDGLHFSPEAYDLLRKELLRIINDYYPEEMPENLPSVFPAWDQVLEGNVIVGN